MPAMAEFTDHYVIFTDKDFWRQYRVSQNVDDELERVCREGGAGLFIQHYNIYRGPYDQHMWDQMEKGGLTEDALPSSFQLYKRIPFAP
jgi:hypothetical protein